MIGAILAGGYGKRLKPITNDIPKSMISIKENFTILDRQISDFRSIGITELYILSGHLGEKIEEYLTPKYKDLKITYFREEKPLGTLYSMRNLLEHRKDEDIMLRNGDTVTDMNFKAMVKFARNTSYGAVIFAVKMRSPYGILEIFGDTVTKFKEKPFINAYINAGIYIFKKDIFDFFFDSYPDKELETTVFPRLASRKQIGAYMEDAFWMGIDSEKDLEAIREEYSNREDAPWGYYKMIMTDKKSTITDYFIRAEEEPTIHIPGQSVVRFNSGSGMVLPENRRFREGSIIEPRGDVVIRTAEPTRLELITIH